MINFHLICGKNINLRVLSKTLKCGNNKYKTYFQINLNKLLQIILFWVRSY